MYELILILLTIIASIRVEDLNWRWIYSIAQSIHEIIVRFSNEKQDLHILCANVKVVLDQMKISLNLHLFLRRTSFNIPDQRPIILCVVN